RPGHLQGDFLPDAAEEIAPDIRKESRCGLTSRKGWSAGFEDTHQHFDLSVFDLMVWQFHGKGVPGPAMFADLDHGSVARTRGIDLAEVGDCAKTEPETILLHPVPAFREGYGSLKPARSFPIVRHPDLFPAAGQGDGFPF